MGISVRCYALCISGIFRVWLTSMFRSNYHGNHSGRHGSRDNPPCHGRFINLMGQYSRDENRPVVKFLHCRLHFGALLLDGVANTVSLREKEKCSGHVSCVYLNGQWLVRPLSLHASTMLTSVFAAETRVAKLSVSKRRSDHLALLHAHTYAESILYISMYIELRAKTTFFAWEKGNARVS